MSAPLQPIIDLDYDDYDDDFDSTLADEFASIYVPPSSNSDNRHRSSSTLSASDDDGDDAAAAAPSASNLRASRIFMMEAKLTAMGTELNRQIDATTMRPMTSGGLRASVDISNKASSSSTSASSLSSQPIPSIVSPLSFRPPTSSSAPPPVRQSLDTFAALDIANTDASLKVNYVKYWDMVEEQFKQEQRDYEALKEKRTRAAEHSHLQRLKLKLDAVARDRDAAASAADPRESGWNDGGHQPVGAADSAPKRDMRTPAVIKAAAAYQLLMTTNVNNAATPSLSNAPSVANLRLLKQQIPTNVKPMPIAPLVIDPSRIRSVVVSHMPSIVLAKLAASRHRSTQQLHHLQQPKSSKRGLHSRGGSAATSVRRASMDGADDDADDASPTRSAKASKPVAMGVRLPAPRPAGIGRSASAGVGSTKPTNAAAIAASERAAQLHSSSTASSSAASTTAPAVEMKSLPLTAYNRLKREVDELRRKVTALERENELLHLKAEEAAAIEDSRRMAKAARVAAAQPMVAIGGTGLKKLSMAKTSTIPAPAPPSSKSNLGSTTSAAPRPIVTALPFKPLITGATKYGMKLNLEGIGFGDTPRVAAVVAVPEDASMRMPMQHLAIPTQQLQPQMLSPRAKCAVSNCGVDRVASKPYCVSHLTTSQHSASNEGSMTIEPSASELFDKAIASAAIAAAKSSSAAPSASPSAASSYRDAPLVGAGMHGVKLTLGGAAATYNYDYESDDNYGGTDNDDDDDGDSNDNVDEDDDDADHDGATASFATFNDDLRIDATPIARQQPDSKRESASAKSSARASSSATNIKSTRQYASSALDNDPDYVDPLSSIVSAPAIGDLICSASPRLPAPASSASASAGAPPRPSAPASALALGVGLAGQGLGLGGLERLRAGPYAGVDGLTGSFEITQSGTFSREGFHLNSRGMTREGDAAAGGGIQTWDANATARMGATSRMGATARLGATVGITPRVLVHASLPPSSLPAPPSTSNRSLDASDLYTLGILGRGSSGVVSRVFHAPSMALLAIKSICINERDKRGQLTAELKTLTLAPHAHTIGFRGAYFDTSHIYIALEYMNRGSLEDLRERQGIISELECAFIFEQVLLGLAHLQKQKIVHRDIKPHNILYNDVGEFKLTDFGIISDLKVASDKAQVAEAKTFVGTLLYMSPERIGGQSYGYPCDIWSMALSLMTCRVGEFAIPHQSHWQLVNSIQAGPAILNAFSSSQISDTMRDLVGQCLRINPAERPTADECLRHQFFNQYRSNGLKQRIPIPSGFPLQMNQQSNDDATSASAKSSSSSSKDQRRADDIDRRNQIHMLESVCALVCARGMTIRSKPVASDPSMMTSSSSLSSSLSAIVAAPIDTRLCDRICTRLATVLSVQQTAVKPILINAHNKHVGWTQ